MVPPIKQILCTSTREGGETLLNFGAVQLETLTPLAKKITRPLITAKNNETLMAKVSHMNLSF